MSLRDPDEDVLAAEFERALSGEERISGLRRRALQAQRSGNCTRPMGQVK